MLGTLHIGDIAAPIDSVELADSHLVLRVTLGVLVVGFVGGPAWITGEDGETIWQGGKLHDYGTKILGVTWNIVFHTDLQAGW